MAKGVEGHLAGHVQDALNVRVVSTQGSQADIQTPDYRSSAGGRHLPQVRPELWSAEQVRELSAEERHHGSRKDSYGPQRPAYHADEL